MEHLAEIQAWYLAQCDGEWEHGSGVTIESLDNPGWRIAIDLRGTALADVPFEEVAGDEDDASDWIRCVREGTSFTGACGPLRLADLIGVFLGWAARYEEAAAPSAE